MNGPHDVGGAPFGPVDTASHEPTDWDRQIDATFMSLAGRGIACADEMRRCVEQLGEEGHTHLTYYERWVAAMMRIMIEKGVLTQDEIDSRVAEIRKRTTAAHG